MDMLEEQSQVKLKENQVAGRSLLNPKLFLVILLVLLATVAIVFGVQAIETFNHQEASNLKIVPDDYPTIQAAIDAAAPGDVIQVKAGTYRESLVINKPISLVAKSYNQDDPTKNTVIIDGSGQTTTITI